MISSEKCGAVEVNGSVCSEDSSFDFRRPDKNQLEIPHWKNLGEISLDTENVDHLSHCLSLMFT